MATIKTRPTGADVTTFLAAVPDPQRRSDGFAVRELMERVTDTPGAMWGPSIVGFGCVAYTNTTGTNEWFVVGFSPRQTALTFYGIYDRYGPADPLLDKLGPHRTGTGCLYVKRLGQIDQRVLERMVHNAWERSPRPN